MDTIIIRIEESTNEEGFMYDIFDSEEAMTNCEDSLDGGLCTGSITDALSMATSQAQDLIRQKTEPNKKELVMFIGNYFDGTEDNWLVFLAPIDCDREAEFKHAFSCDSGEPMGEEIVIGEIYDITTAYDYRAKDSGSYDIKLIK